MTSPRLLLLTGWAMHPASLTPLVNALGQLKQPIAADVIQLPNLLESTLEDWMQHVFSRLAPLQEQTPHPPWVGGWSLGGMLATRLAAQAPDCFRGVVSLAANARFVATPDWPSAMPPPTFDGFMQRYQQSAATTLRRFSRLCRQGETTGGTAEALSSVMQSPDSAGQSEQLELLATLDNRAPIRHLACPQLHLLASNDALVPVNTAQALAQLNPRYLTTACVPGGHLFPFSQPDATAARISRFIHQAAHG